MKGLCIVFISLHDTVPRACITTFQCLLEICRAILANQLILWLELKVATALASLSVIIKHKLEKKQWLNGHRPVAVLVWTPLSNCNFIMCNFLPMFECQK